MFKLLSWNIQQGGGSRVLDIISFLLSEKPECIILNEFKNNEKGLSIRTKLLSSGYIHQAITDAPSDKNSVLIASKVSGNIFLFPGEEKDYPYACVRMEMEALDVYGVYLPHKKKHTWFPIILEHLKERNRPAIIAGDFNTGINKVDQKGSSFMYSEYLPKMNVLGYKDAFRFIHDDVEEYSWYSHQGNGYRYDHTYCHEDLLPLVKNCYYIHEARKNKWSDHSPMVLELG